MRRLNATAPRSATVIAGRLEVPVDESATMIASAASRSRFSCRKFANDCDRYSSSPSMNSEMPRSKSAPSTSVSARMAPMCAMTPALSSAAPRP